MARKAKKLSFVELYAAEMDTIEARRKQGLYDHGDLRKLVQDAAIELGHQPLRQGASIECSRCGVTGTAGTRLIGPIFTSKCGATNG